MISGALQQESVQNRSSNIEPSGELLSCWGVIFMKHSLLAILCALSLAHSSQSASSLVVSPFATGNAGTAAPFVLPSDLVPSVRYQQVYGASDFSLANPNQPFLITGIELGALVGPGTSPINIDLGKVRIDLSTTGRNPDGLSSAFTDNVGLNDAIVYSGPLHFIDLV